MRFARAILLAASLAAVVVADADNIKLRDGKEYKDVVVKRAEPDGLVVVTKTGIVKLYFTELPDDLQQKYHYDAASAAAYAAAQAEKQRQLSQQISPPTAQPATAATPVAAAPPAAPAPAPAGPGIVLAAGWAGAMQGGAVTLRDLGRLLSPHAKPAANLGPAPNIEIYGGVRYLTPLPQALAQLGLQNRMASKNAVICPGLPRGLSYSAIDGTFEGEFNRMYVVTDRADQVVSIQLVSEHPMQSARKFARDKDATWTCYNFINYRVKASDTLRIAHDVNDERDVIQIDTLLLEPKPKSPANKKSKNTKPAAVPDRVVESVRWFVPKPLAEMILFCIRSSGNT